MEGFPRISRTMSAGPGPPKSPAPHPPRRGNSVTAGRLTRYRSIREHKSVLDFGRDWRDWDVDIFQDDETVSNATTETGTATSIGVCFGIAVDEENVAPSDAKTRSPAAGKRTQQQTTPSSAARRRTAPALSALPQTPLQSRSHFSQWQWRDTGEGSSSPSPLGRGWDGLGSGLEGFGAGCGDAPNYSPDLNWGFGSGNNALGITAYIAAGTTIPGAAPAASSSSPSTSSGAPSVPPLPESPVRFSYPNRRRPKAAPNYDATDNESPNQRSSHRQSQPQTQTQTPSPLQGGSRPPSEPGSLFSLARTSSGSRSPAPGASSTQTAAYPLGQRPPAPSAGSALLLPASAADAAEAQTQSQHTHTQAQAHAFTPSSGDPGDGGLALIGLGLGLGLGQGLGQGLGPGVPRPPRIPPPPVPSLVPTTVTEQALLPPVLPAVAARDLPPPVPQLRPRSHNPVLISTSSTCADLRLSARADHARSQIITKLALHPIPSKELVRDAEWERPPPPTNEYDQRQHHQYQQPPRHSSQPQQQPDGEDDQDPPLWGQQQGRAQGQNQQQDEAARWADEVARLEAETDRILAEQKRKDLARLQAQLAAVPDPPPRVRSPIVDKFAFFLRKGRRSDTATTLTKSPALHFQPLSRDCRPVSTMDPSRFIQAGGGGIVPQIDAPTSASNSGERRVTIRCMQSSISLPVTPDTTPADILYSAANLMTQNINPKTSTVMECYFAFGLDRRVRRYERVRDVLNSWDRDSQHCLLIVPGDSVDKNPDLNLESVPRTIDAPPGFVNFSISHCSRPGKWNKRYFTLLETGQMFSAKKKDAKASDKDSTSICHLSDFDLYSVTEKDMLKQIRAPKKHTFAVKSQQKSSVFQNTENFIHFFSTDDVRLAEDFKKALHAWRSWYLVNKKVDLTKTKKSHSSDKSPKAAGLTRSGTMHRPKPSVDESPYTIGTFSPLLDLNKFDKPLDEFGKDPLPEPQTSRLAEPQGAHKHKVVSRARTTPNLAASQPTSRRHIDPFAKDQEFRSGGLLGRGYEGRKHQAEKAAVAAAVEEYQYAPEKGFTGGKSLLTQYVEPQGQLPERRGTVRSSRSAAEHPPQPRSRSRPPVARPTTSSRPKTSDGPSAAKHNMPQPLVDLTPKVPDLPAAWRDGHGRGIRAPSGKPLIEMATGWENQPDATMSPQLPTVTRMNTTKAYPPQRMASQSAASRPRSRSTAGNGAPVRRVVSNEQPPMPSLPRRTSRQNDEDVPLINFVERDRGRDARPRAPPQGLGRSGTVRH